MASTLDELQQQLLQGDQASGNLAGLDERYERANALRDQPIQEMKGNATGTGLSAIANLMNSYTGNKRAAALEPQRAAAREQMAGAKHALPMYNAQRAEDATVLAAQNRAEDLGIDDNIRAQRQANFEREFEQKGMLERAKAKQAKDKAAETARLKGALTQSQLQTGADKLEKKLKPVESMQQAIGRLDEKLAPYSKGGAKEGESIGGIGGIGGMRGEGITGTIGDIWRWVDDATTSGQGDSASVSAAVAGVIAPIIRNQAGLAQTMSETKKVIDAYSLQSISNEEQFLEALPYIKEAVSRDLARINANTLDPVKEHYETNMAELDYGNSAFDRIPQQLDFSSREGVNAPTAPTMVAQKLDAAGQPIFNATGTAVSGPQYDPDKEARFQEYKRQRGMN